MLSSLVCTVNFLHKEMLVALFCMWRGEISNRSSHPEIFSTTENVSFLAKCRWKKMVGD